MLSQFLSQVMVGTAGLCTGDWIDTTSLTRPGPPPRGAPPATTPGYGARPLFGQRLLQHGGTSVWDGLACGINAVASDGETPRRVVIVLTDGMDYTSSTTPASVIAHANDAGVMIYTVGLIGSEGLAAGALRGVAEATGGGYFSLNSRADMVDAFGRIAEELRHQYVLAFSAPGLTRASHDVKVRALRADTTTRSRRVFMEAAPVETRRAGRDASRRRRGGRDSDRGSAASGHWRWQRASQPPHQGRHRRAPRVGICTHRPRRERHDSGIGNRTGDDDVRIGG